MYSTRSAYYIYFFISCPKYIITCHKIVQASAIFCTIFVSFNFFIINCKFKYDNT